MFAHVIFSKPCLNSRKFSDGYKATVGERYAANVVDQPGVSSDGLNSYVPCHMWRFFFSVFKCWLQFLTGL